MTPDIENRLRQVVRGRVEAQREEIKHSLKQIAAGNPLGAEQDPRRREQRIKAKTGMPSRDASSLSSMIGQMAQAVESAPTGAEAIQGPTIDFVGVEFLSLGRRAASAVGRVIFNHGRPQGSGFLVGPGLFLTNHHVIDDRSLAAQLRVEFDYEFDDTGIERPVTSFCFDPERCFASEPIEGLDFTLIALGSRLSGTKALEAFGYIPLSDASDKHMLGEIANIVQHPKGDFKQLVIRENNLISRDETNQVLHYLADTDKGSSGSPVFNNQWEAIALHHWGEPWLEFRNAAGQALRREVNEGIRISAIVKWLRTNVRSLSPPTAQAVAEVLDLWDRAPRRGPVGPEVTTGTTVNSDAATRSPRIASDGSITWTFPIEISVRAPLLTQPQPVTTSAPTIASPPKKGAERGRTGDIDFRDRGGYEPGFIPGFVVPLPDLSNVGYPLAANLRAGRRDDPHELRYHHFSIVMNAQRRLASVTACNIDGARVVAVNRSDKTIIANPSLKDLGVEAWNMEVSSSEASDDFQPDPRLADDEQMTIEFYKDQVVPGFDKPAFPGRDATDEEKRAYYQAMSKRTARMFQKGHIIMRGDPAWGIEEEALAAESDTFFYTNAAPQLGFFNQGSPNNRPGAKGKLRWRAVETYILRNAVTMKQRITVFAGPVFDNDADPEYRFGSRVPMRFWKVAIWADDEGLRSIALLADQRKVLDTLTEGIPEAMERFDDEDELARVTEFLTTVDEIEALAKIDFGSAVRETDISRGSEGLQPAIEVSSSLLNSKRQHRRLRRR